MYLTVKTHALLAYDCGGTHLNTTTISIIHTGECNLEYTNPITTPTYIQLLQLSNYNYVNIIQCKVQVYRTIYHCGMHSHISAVHNGQATYLHETTRERCQAMHQNGVLHLGTAGPIDQLKANGTHYRSATLAGKVGVDGACKGAMYSDYYGTWDDVIVQADVVISMRTGYVPVNLESHKVILKSGTTCPLSDGNCLDSDDGYTYWQPFNDDICRLNQYDVLYEGMATKMKGNHTMNDLTVYTLTTNDVTFALTTTRPHTLCGYTILGTEHPKLFIFETVKGNVFKTKTRTPISNLDIFVYVNSKFVYVERHLRTQMQTLYYDLVQQKCELERQVLQNTLSFATFLPDEFAYRLMKVPGYMAVTAGEVVHVIKCIPLDVTLRPTETCYSDLPVALTNSTYFITPKSRILIKHSTIRDCNSPLPLQYYIEDTWVQFSPTPNLVLPPQTLKPLTKLTWVYTTPSSLATSGIYSNKDLENLRNHIMFPAEKSAVLHTIAKGFTGQTITDTSISLKNLLDKDVLEEIYTSTASKLWASFTIFGTASAGVFGIFIIIRVIKVIFDTIIHGVALHSAYGCSMHLLGAIWSSITHLLLHLANNPKEERSKLATDQPIEGQTGRTSPKEDPTPTLEQPSGPNASAPKTYTYRELKDRIEQIS